tara:strand:- start:2227 stop:2682 length:456 start_codon:yes stop_codon:yes gene_type:complete
MGGNLVNNAVKVIDDYENPKNPPKKETYDDLYRDSHSNYKEMFGGALEHGAIMKALLKSKPEHFWVLRHTARQMRDGLGGGDLLGKDAHTWGAMNDIAGARDNNHLVDMVYNDKLMGGGSFLSTLKSIGNGVLSVGKAVMPFAPLIAKAIL